MKKALHPTVNNLQNRKRKKEAVIAMHKMLSSENSPKNVESEVSETAVDLTENFARKKRIIQQ